MADEQLGRLLILLEANTAKIDEQIQQTKQHFDDLTGTLGLVKDALTALGVFEVFDKVISATAEAEKAQALLASQIKATGDASGLTAKQLEDMAQGFQDSTTFSRIQVEQLESQLMAFRNVAGQQFKGAIQAALDFATVTGRDPVEAVRTLGMALNDPVTGMQRLTRAGIQVDDATKATIKSLAEQGDLISAQDLLLQRMEESYGGAAKAARDTLGGALQALKNDLGEVLEGNGGGVTAVTDAVKDLDAELKDPAVQQGLANLISGLLHVAAAGGEVLAKLGKIPAALGEALAQGQGYTGNFDDQITRLNGLISQTQQQLDGLKGTGTAANPSEEVKALQRQLAEYKYQLQDVQLYQQALTGKSGLTPTEVTPATPTLSAFPDVDPAKTAKLALANMKEVWTGYENLAQAQKAAIEDWKQINPAAYLQEQIDKTQELVGVMVDGVTFTQDDANHRIAQLRLEYDKQLDGMTAASQSAAQGMQSDFQQYLMDPFKEGLGGLAKAFEQTLLQMLAQAEAAQLFKTLFGGSDTTGQNNGTVGLGIQLANFFGGHRAGGGPVSAGMLYQVNEGGSGTEAFVPGSGGAIVPLGNSRGGASLGDLNLTYHINAGNNGAAGADLLAMMPALRRMFHSDVEHYASRGVWPA